MVALRYRGGKFIAEVSFAEREIPRKAGFRFVFEKRYWYTTNPSVAARLREFADEPTKYELARHLLDISPWSLPLRIPPSLKLKPFQPEGVRFILSRNRSYLAFDPGLGKTVVAAVAAATLKGHAVVYICPPFLTYNVQEEFRMWAPKLKTMLVTAKTNIKDVRAGQADVLIVGDSLILRRPVRELIESHAVTTVKNFLIVDEAHRYNLKPARRSKVLYGFGLGKKVTTKFGLVAFFDRVALLSGTPMPNRPMDLYTMLSRMAPETIDFMTREAFGVHYCDGKRNHFGWDFSGSSNVEELADRVIAPTGPFMLRVRKSAVKGLPKRIEELLIVDKDIPPTLAKLEKEIVRKIAPEDLVKAAIAGKLGMYEDELHFMTYRKLLGIEKVPFTAAYVDDLLDTTDENILLFANHKEVIAKLKRKLYRWEPIIITGDTPAKQRHKLVSSFQNNHRKRLVIANIRAGGIGYNMTKARRCILHEYSFSPADNGQAIDRAHRTTQTQDVLAQYVVFRNSADRNFVLQLLKKSESMRHI